MAVQPIRAAVQPEVEEGLPWKVLWLEKSGNELGLKSCQLSRDVHKIDPTLRCVPRAHVLAREQGGYAGCGRPVRGDERVDR